MEVYRNYDQAELDAQYDQATRVPDLAPYLRFWDEASAEARRQARTARLGLAYGIGEMERLDLLTGAGRSPCPVVVFLHGGAWRREMREASHYPAIPVLARGAAFAALGFSAAPNARLPELVDQVRRGLAYIWRNAEILGIDRERISLMAHSSGSHLAAMLLSDGWHAKQNLPPSIVKSACLVSGVYDLEPVRLSSRNAYLKLTSAEASLWAE